MIWQSPEKKETWKKRRLPNVSRSGNHTWNRKWFTVVLWQLQLERKTTIFVSRCGNLKKHWGYSNRNEDCCVCSHWLLPINFVVGITSSIKIKIKLNSKVKRQRVYMLFSLLKPISVYIFQLLLRAFTLLFLYSALTNVHVCKCQCLMSHNNASLFSDIVTVCYLPQNNLL